MRVTRLIDQADRETVIQAIDAIFFEASRVTSFADAAARAAFRERWLGLYLSDWPEHVVVARDADGTVAGYLVGCLVDPATDARFADIGYFQVFAAACAAYPAHLHINLAPAYRDRGIGGQLVEAFGAAARDAGAPGMHIVTGDGARNAGFYRRLGFESVARTVWNANPICFLGRRLTATGP